MVVQPLIKLETPKTRFQKIKKTFWQDILTGKTIKEQASKTGSGLKIQVLPITGTTGAVAGTLNKVGKVVVKDPIKTAKVATTTGIVVGAASTSETVRTGLKNFPRPVETGKFVGTTIEKVKEGTNVPSFKEGLKTAGLIGGATALAGGSVVVYKKIKEKLSSKKNSINNFIPSQLSGGSLAASSPALDSRQIIEPIGAVQEAPEVVQQPVASKIKPINVRTNVNVNIDQRRYKRKTFKNNAVLVRI